MRRFARPARILRFVLLAGGFVAACVLAIPAQAQQAAIRWKSAPLEAALLELADAADIELVFAHRLVVGRRVSGTWRPGEDPAEALADLLEGTRLRAERIRTRQYVIIAEPLNVVVEPDDPAAYTGVLQGTIVDADTDLPLPGAHALLVDLSLGGVADGDGAFFVPGLPTGEYTVQFSHIGYRSVRVVIDVYPESSLLPPTIRLRPEPFSLGGATVRPRTDPAPGAGATDLPSAGGRSSGRQAGALPADPGAGDLIRALEWLPGVSRAPGAGAGLAIRGLDPSLLRTYRDGAPVLEAAHGAGLVGPFQPEALRGVRLHRGTPPAELGGGLAGALEVETADARSAGAPWGVAALGPLAARIAGGAPLGPFAGLAAAARISALGWPSRAWPAAPALHSGEGALVLDPLGGPLRHGDDGLSAEYSFHDMDATLSVAVTNRQRLTLGGWMAGDRVDVEGPVDVRGRWNTGVASVRHRALIGETFVAATMYASRYGADERAAVAGASRAYRTELSEMGMRLEGDRYLSLAHTLRIGASLARRALEAELGDASDTVSVEAVAVETSAWIQDTWQPMPGWQLEAGLRAEVYGPHSRISPRILARWSALPERLYVRAGLGRQTQGLHRLPDSGPAVPARASARWLLAGRDARPADTWQAGAGIEWAPLLGLAVSADVYARRTGATLEPRPDAAGVDDTVDPAAVAILYAPVTGRAAGLELAARAEGGPWVLGVAYSLARADSRTPPPVGGAGAGSWRRARHDRPHVLGLLIQHERNNWRATARVDVLSRPPGVTTRVAPAIRVELAAGYRFEALGAHWDVQARAQPTAARGGPPVAVVTAPTSMVPAPVAFAADGATLPAWPVASLRVAW